MCFFNKRTYPGHPLGQLVHYQRHHDFICQPVGFDRYFLLCELYLSFSVFKYQLLGIPSAQADQYLSIGSFDRFSIVPVFLGSPLRLSLATQSPEPALDDDFLPCNRNYGNAVQ